MKLSQLSAPMVREFEDKLARGDMPEGAEPQPRSPAMVRKVRVSLSSLLSDAQERGLVSRNVVRDLREDAQRAAPSGRPRSARRASSRSASTFPPERRSRPLWRPPRAAGGRSC